MGRCTRALIAVDRLHGTLGRGGMTPADAKEGERVTSLASGVAKLSVFAIAIAIAITRAIRRPASAATHVVPMGLSPARRPRPRARPSSASAARPAAAAASRSSPFPPNRSRACEAVPAVARHARRSARVAAGATLARRAY